MYIGNTEMKRLRPYTSSLQAELLEGADSPRKVVRADGLALLIVFTKLQHDKRRVQ